MWLWHRDGQNQDMLRDVSDGDMTLKDIPFYISVDNEEKRQVYVAMAREFTGTGHCTRVLMVILLQLENQAC